MASKKTLNAKNLEALGAPRLAELLLELSAGDAAAKRHLRLALAGSMGAPEVAKEVRKRLTTIAKSRSFVEWDKKNALIQDLETQLDAIVEKVAPAEPSQGLDLPWRFLGLAGSIFERCDDSSGRVGDVFHAALRCAAGRQLDQCLGGFGRQMIDQTERLEPLLGKTTSHCRA